MPRSTKAWFEVQSGDVEGVHDPLQCHGVHILKLLVHWRLVDGNLDMCLARDSPRNAEVVEIAGVDDPGTGTGVVGPRIAEVLGPGKSQKLTGVVDSLLKTPLCDFESGCINDHGFIIFIFCWLSGCVYYHVPTPTLPEGICIKVHVMFLH
jgi:hypothetical protein